MVNAVERVLASFQQQRVRSVMLDLRANPVGRLDVGARLLGDFVPPDSPVLQQTDRGGTHQVRRAGPLVVLIDKDTASIAELFAAAVHEYGAS